MKQNATIVYVYIDFCFDSSARQTLRNEHRRHLTPIITACCQLRSVPLRVRPLRQIISVHQGRHRYMRVAVCLRTSLQVTVTSATRQMETVSRAALRVLSAAAANQKTRKPVTRVNRRIRRTVIRPDAVHLRLRQQSRQVLLNSIFPSFILGTVWLAKRLWFSFAKNCGFRFSFSFTELSAVSFFSVQFFTFISVPSFIYASTI